MRVNPYVEIKRRCHTRRNENASLSRTLHHHRCHPLNDNNIVTLPSNSVLYSKHCIAFKDRYQRGGFSDHQLRSRNNNALTEAGSLDTMNLLYHNKSGIFGSIYQLPAISPRAELCTSAQLLLSQQLHGAPEIQTSLGHLDKHAAIKWSVAQLVRIPICTTFSLNRSKISSSSPPSASADVKNSTSASKSRA